MTARQHPLRALARTWWLIPIVLAAALLAAFVLTQREAKTYRASTAVLVIPNGVVVESVRDMIDGLANLDRRNLMATLARVARSSDMIARAAEKIGMTDADRRHYSVRSIVSPNSNIIEIEVLGPDATGCATLANALTTISASETTDVYRIYRMKVLEPAEASTRPVSPDLQRNLAVAAILGLAGGLLLAAAVEWARAGLRAPPSP